MSVFTIGFDIQTIFACAVAFLILTWWLRRPRNLPPGPLGWPVVGYLPNLVISLYRSGLPPHHLLKHLANKHGPIFSMYIGGKLIVVLNTYNSIKEGFQNPHLNDRPKSHFFEELNIGNGVLQSSGEVWKQQRRFTLSTLRSFGVGKRSFEERISEELEALSKEIDLLKDNPFDPRILFTNATANIVCSVVFGNRFDYSDRSFRHLIDSFEERAKHLGAGGLSLFLPFAKYFVPTTYKILKKNTESLITFISDIIDKHKAVHDPNNPSDYVDVYLNEIEINNKLNLKSHVNIHNQITSVINLLGAGTETTSTTLRWVVLYMMAYPKIQDRIQKEMDLVISRNRLPRLADKESLPFTLATLLEIQRIASVAPLGVVHYSGEDTTLEGYLVPRGSVIIPNLWAVHFDPDTWQNPEEFKPERFLNEDGDLQEREELIPFSIGRRMCLGEHLAKMELFIFFTHLLHQFTFKKPDDSPPLSFEGVNGGIVHSPGPFLTKVIKRD